MQNCRVLLKVIKTKTKATEEVLKKYHHNGYNSAREIAKALLIDIGFAESRTRKKEGGQWFKYETEDESCETSQEDQFKTNFFLLLTDYAACCLKDRLKRRH